MYSILDNYIQNDRDIFRVFTSYLTGEELYYNTAVWSELMKYDHPAHYQFILYYQTKLTAKMAQLSALHGESVKNLANYIDNKLWNYIMEQTSDLTKMRPIDNEEDSYINYMAVCMVKWVKENNYEKNLPGVEKGDYYRMIHMKPKPKL